MFYSILISSFNHFGSRNKIPDIFWRGHGVIQIRFSSFSSVHYGIITQFGHNSSFALLAKFIVP
jgi:hypothetical protein